MSSSIVCGMVSLCSVLCNVQQLSPTVSSCISWDPSLAIAEPSHHCRSYCFPQKGENTILTHKSVENHLKYGPTHSNARGTLAGDLLDYFGCRMGLGLVQAILVKA